MRELVTERILDQGMLVEVLSFDKDGKLVHLLSRTPDGHQFQRDCFTDENGFEIKPDNRIVHLSDGGRIEIEKLKLDNWSLNRLPNFAMGTHGASTAETAFDRQGVPGKTLFRDDRGSVLSTVDYICDHDGRILQLTQASAETESFRLTLKYAPNGKIEEQKLWFQGELTHQSYYTYNDCGDTAAVTTLDGGAGRTDTFDYEYDGHGNWILQIVHHALGSDKIRRRISYDHGTA